MKVRLSLSASGPAPGTTSGTTSRLKWVPGFVPKFVPRFVPALVLAVAAAAAAPAAGAGGSAERGEVLAYTCHGCHGLENYKNAYPNYNVPRLGGQSAAYLVTALREYATGERSHPTMHAQASTLSDQDRADIAAFLQGRMVQPRNETVGTPPQSTQTCAACHGANGAKAILPEYPILAGQHADYIVHALRAYKSGERKNPIMAGIIAGIDEADFEEIAGFFAQQPGLCGTDEIRDHGTCPGTGGE